MKSDMEKQINNMSMENIRMKEMTGAIHDNYNIKPSFPLWIGCRTLLNKVIKEVGTIIPPYIIHSEDVINYHLYCYPSQIIHGCIHLLKFTANTIITRETEIFIRTNKKGSFLCIEIEYRNALNFYEDIKKLFHPRVYDDPKESFRGLGLYLTKFLVELNAGTIHVDCFNNNILFCIQFLSEKKI